MDRRLFNDESSILRNDNSFSFLTSLFLVFRIFQLSDLLSGLLSMLFTNAVRVPLSGRKPHCTFLAVRVEYVRAWARIARDTYICEENVHQFSSHVNEYGQHPMNRDTYRNDIYMLSLQSQKLIKENNAEDTPASGICNVDAVTAHVIHNASYVILSSST